MKRILILTVLVALGLATGATAQTVSKTSKPMSVKKEKKDRKPTTQRLQGRQFDDTSRAIVERYLGLMNFDGLKKDSTLYIESTIHPRTNPEDSIVMKRWFEQPAKYRVELWDGDEMQIGFRSNGVDLFLEYDMYEKRWYKLDVGTYYEKMGDYNFRGSLYDWKGKELYLKYDGEWEFQGHKVDRVTVRSMTRYDRLYFFEKESGLLFLIDELDSHNPDREFDTTTHIDWRAFQEYQPVGDALLPSEESYQTNDGIILIHHRYKYVPNNEDIYLDDKL